MNNFLNFLTASWSEALGWSLLHSLWQALLVVLIVFVTLRFVSKQASTIRYWIATVSLGMIILSTLTTFIILLPGNSHSESLLTPSNFMYADLVTDSNLSSGYVNSFSHFIHDHMQLWIIIWASGVVLFSLRLIGGWFYINRLRNTASLLEDKWTKMIGAFAQKLSINKIVKLGESTLLQAPVAIGYLKPIILFPIGMIEGLTAEEVETILLHELAHIKRHDYLVNVIQSIIESILFFNPFVWILSNLIRQEREHCCDDVVTQHGNALAYAYALTRLEEIRLTQSTLALSITGNKNQLLLRIKRIMEKSAKNYTYRDRIIPIAFLVIGLACASFLTIKSSNNSSDENDNTFMVAADTVKPKRSEKSATYTRKSITSLDENGQPKEEIIENFEGDEELQALFQDDFEGVDFNFSLPPLPDLSMLEDLNVMIPPMPGFQFSDTIPGATFHWNHDGDWKEFSKEFEEHFKQHFGDFYTKNGEEFEKMMKEMESKFDHRWEGRIEEAMGRQQEAMSKIHNQDWEKHQKEAFKRSEEAMRRSQEAMARMHEAEWHEKATRKMEDNMSRMKTTMRKMEENMKEMEENMKAFQAETQEQLIKDGYLGKGEKIKSMNWDDDGEIEINGKKIKEKDKAKYQKIHKMYFKDKGSFRYVE